MSTELEPNYSRGRAAIQCPSCGADNRPSDNCCCKCGARLPNGRCYCPNCGRSFPQDVIHCTNCGTATVPGDPPQSNTYAQSTKSSMPTESSYNWLTALLLSIFVGGLGIHRFYVGKTGTGILWLLTCGCFFIGWIIDIVTIVSGKFTDQYGLPLIDT